MMSGENRGDSQTLDPSAHSNQAIVNWPLRDRPVTSALLVTGCVMIGLISGYLSGSGVMGCLAAIAMMLALWPMWVPIRIEVGPLGITLSYVHRRRRIAWRDIDHLESLGRGLNICGKWAGASGSWIERLFLPWGQDHSQITPFTQMLPAQRDLAQTTSPPTAAAEMANRPRQASS